MPGSQNNFSIAKLCLIFILIQPIHEAAFGQKETEETLRGLKKVSNSPSGKSDVENLTKIKERIKKEIRLSRRTLPPGVELLVPEGAMIEDVQETSLRMNRQKEIVVFYSYRCWVNENTPDEGLGKLGSGVEVLAQQGGKYSVLMQTEYPEQSLTVRRKFKANNVSPNSSGAYQLAGQNGQYLLFVEHAIGASVGGTLVVYRWNGKDFEEIPVAHEWGFRLEDLEGNGEKEVICQDRYGPDAIFKYRNERFVFSNYDYPSYFLPKAEEIEKRMSDPTCTAREKLQEEEVNDFLPVFLYTGRLKNGLKVVEKMRELLKERQSEEPDRRLKPEILKYERETDERIWNRKFHSFQANVLKLEAKDELPAKKP